MLVITATNQTPQTASTTTTTDPDLKLVYKQQVVDVAGQEPAADDLARRWEMSSQADLSIAIGDLVKSAPVVVRLWNSSFMPLP